MAKHRKIRVSWKRSRTATVNGYKLYWSKDASLDYNSRNVDIGNVAQVVLPDALELNQLHRGPLRFGLTAVDQNENESDLCIIGSFQLFESAREKNRPAAPEPAAPELDQPQDTGLSDPDLRLLFTQLNAPAHQAQRYEQSRGLTPLVAHERAASPDTIREAKSALKQLNRQLDRLLPQT